MVNVRHKLLTLENNRNKVEGSLILNHGNKWIVNLSVYEHTMNTINKIDIYMYNLLTLIDQLYMFQLSQKFITFDEYKK